MSDLFAVFGVNWKLLIIQAFNFAVLLAVLSYFLYRPILRIIDDRQKKIAEGVRTAEEADGKLAEAKGKSEDMIGHAAREAEGLVAAARSRASESAAEMQRAAEARAEATLKDAQARAEEAQRLAIKESEKDIARAAMLAAEKILRQKA